MKKMNQLLIIAALVCHSAFLWSMGGPGGGGGGDCFQYNTVGTITQCTNCTVVDGNAVGDIAGDASMTVTATSCGPVTIRIRYQYDWQ